MRRSPVFPYIEIAIPSFRHSRYRCTCALHWLANWGDMMCKVNKIVVKLVDSTVRDLRPGTPKDMTLVSFNSERPRCSVDAKHVGRIVDCSLNDSGATHFCVAPTARPGASYDLTLTSLGKKRKKAVRGVRFKSGLYGSTTTRSSHHTEMVEITSRRYTRANK